MLSFKKINNFNVFHKFQEKVWNSSERWSFRAHASFGRT